MCNRNFKTIFGKQINHESRNGINKHCSFPIIEVISLLTKLSYSICELIASSSSSQSLNPSHELISTCLTQSPHPQKKNETCPKASPIFTHNQSCWISFFFPHQHMQHLSTSSLKQFLKIIQGSNLNKLTVTIFSFQTYVQAYETISRFKCQFTKESSFKNNSTLPF